MQSLNLFLDRDNILLSHRAKAREETQEALEVCLIDHKKNQFYIGLDEGGKIYARQPIGTGEERVWTIFQRVHGLPNAISLDRKTHFFTQLSESAIPHLICGQLHIHFRLRGGMMVAGEGARAAASCINNALGFFKVNSYRKLVQQAGAESRATIKVGGQEVRATIEKAEDSACKTVSRCQSAVRSSLGTAREEMFRVLGKTRQEMESIIAIGGIEARHSSKHLAIQVEYLMQKGALEANGVLSKAGQETRQAIQLANEEARITTLLLSGEANKIIQTSGERVNQCIKSGSEEIQTILSQSAIEAKSIIEIAGDEWSARSIQIINAAERCVQQTLSQLLQESEESLSRLIGQVGEEANGVVLNLGRQGNLLIQDTGEEVRVTADHVLAKAFHGQEMIIKGFGDEARLTVTAFGNQIRSTLYQLPFIASLTAEQIGRSLVHGLRAELIGSSQVEELNFKIRQAMCSTTEINIIELLTFVGDQSQSSIRPQDKVELYKGLINLFNSPVFPEEKRKYAFVLIGVTAIKDERLTEMRRTWWGWGYLQQVDFAQKVIDTIPGEARSLLTQKREKSLDIFKPLVEPLSLEDVIKQEQITFQDIKEVQEKVIALNSELEKMRLENAYLCQLNHEKEALIESQKKDTTAESLAKDQEILEVRQQLVKNSEEIEKLKLEIRLLRVD